MSTKASSYDESQIQVLEGLEAVRKRPGMYIGSTGPAGLHHLVYEVLDNSIDEALAGYCKNIVVEILPGDIIRVVDDGRGIPVGIQHKLGIPAVTVVFTVLHAGGKFGGGGYKVSGGLHGVGASVVNALSEYLEVEVCDGEKRYRQRFERGAVVSPLEVVGTADFTGTTVVFKPDAQIFEETEFDYDTLLARIREQAFLNAGLCIRLVDSRTDDIREETLCYEGGIRQFVTWLQERRAVDPLHEEIIYLSAASGDDMVEIALQYNNSYNETLLSFANNIHTGDGGTHEVGFKAALTRVMNDYARKCGAIKDADKSKNLSGDDVREGLTAIISVKLLEPQFEGQTKAKLGNTAIRSLVDGAVSDKLSTFFEENPAVARTILDKALAASRAREAAKRAREAERKKSTMENTRLPGKLADCAERGERTEIYIVEGDSAGGSAKQGRDRNFQAILPLWGKMLNVERSRLDKVYGNDKLMPVVVALGCGIGEDFDVSKLRYNKVVIMADADVDGSHIRTLLLTFFFRFMRPLIDHGHVYIAQPPLYKLSRGKLVRYAYTDEERDSLSAGLFEGKAELQRYKGLGEMNPEQLWETTMDPATRIMLRVHMEDAIKADETFSILMGDKVGPRKEFIEQNAKYVVNLDV